MVSTATPKTRLLLVDDEARLTELLRMELEVEGYEVDVAADGATGLIRARTEPSPDLIVLDWNLPDFSGVDICQRIRSSAITTPILMLTGHDDVADRVTALDAGVDDYLVKPFSIEELMARLRAMQRRASTFSAGSGDGDHPETLQVADLVMNTSTTLRYTFGDVLLSIYEANILLDLEDEARIKAIESLTLSHPEAETVEVWSTGKGTARPQGQPESNDDNSINLRGVPTPSATYIPQMRVGRWLQPGDKYAMVLSQEVAKQIGVGVGDWITIDIPTTRQSDWQVVGLLFEPVDQKLAVASRDTLLKETRQVGQGKSIRVQTLHGDPESEAVTAAELRAIYEGQGYDVLPSTKDTSYRLATRQADQMALLFIILTGMAVMTAIVGAVALSGTLSINVMERTREIGVMRAIGASAGVVAGQFVGEGLILGWLSWLLAIPLSFPAGLLIVRTLSAVLSIELVYQVSWVGIGYWLITITVLAVIASWFPAQKAAQTSVRESLAYV